MSRILELFRDLEDARFINDIFVGDEYKDALPQLTIIDAGAFEGEFSFYAFNCARRIYAIEPDPRPFAVLKQRVKKYELGDVIKVYNKALASAKGKHLFHASGYGGSRLIQPEEEEYADPKGDNMMRVSTMTLTELFEKEKIKQVDLLKIDIEGGEYKLITDPAFRDLAPKIKVIVGEHLGDTDTVLKELGYKSRKGTAHNTIYEHS